MTSFDDRQYGRLDLCQLFVSAKTEQRRNGTPLAAPGADWELVTATLYAFDPKSLRPEKPCLDLSE